MANVLVFNLKKGSRSDQFRAFARKTISEKYFISQEELCQLAKERFKKKYFKGHFLGAIILDPDIEFQKVEGELIFFSQGILVKVDRVWKQTQTKRAA